MATASEQFAAGSTRGIATEEQRQAAALAKANRARQRQSLDLQRERILSQRTSNATRRSALEAALKQIEEQIAALG